MEDERPAPPRPDVARWAIDRASCPVCRSLARGRAVSAADELPRAADVGRPGESPLACGEGWNRELRVEGAAFMHD